MQTLPAAASGFETVPGHVAVGIAPTPRMVTVGAVASGQNQLASPDASAFAPAAVPATPKLPRTVSPDGGVAGNGPGGPMRPWTPRGPWGRRGAFRSTC